MLKLKNLIKGDILFQFKYGFYYLYIIIICLYIVLLSMLSGNIKSIICDTLILSDPGAMGMFFMGAIILLEKSERIVNSIAVSPINTCQYILSKVLSISLISVIAGSFLILESESSNIMISLTGIFLSSVLFTLLGLIIGTKAISLNQYVIYTVPFEIILFVPAVLKRVGLIKKSSLLFLNPGCLLINLVQGDSSTFVLSFIISLFFIILFFIIAKVCVSKMFNEAGGIKL